ncbi:uncharacterized protein LOC121739885 [Aricia agestis]|uniref:uncharacterized protein LOC121729062 n=1 Tax=Aricia agestis TaxID=91739 RepID=UPI001C20B10D|nr:uncharacterized protein LOC121729062 [Aricia agestis]XP_041985232.1 uncharacterized protein LOC121737638 [Aricia agestis]XP_041988411.1 uncharacterized protein LOC121739885 [Aricia agestis]
MLGSPNNSGKCASNPDIRKSVEDHNVTLRPKRKHTDDLAETIDEVTSKVTTMMNDWKNELQDNFTKMKIEFESVLKADLDKLTTSLSSSFAEIKTEINTVRQEYNEFKKSVHSLELKHQETSKKISDLEDSLQFYSNQQETTNKKVDALTVERKAIQSLEARIQSLSSENQLLQIELNQNNQRDRLLNLEIVGVIEQKSENLLDIILSIAQHSGVSLFPQDVLEVNRVTPRSKQPGRPRNIIVKLRSRLLKDNMISGARKSPLTAKDLGLTDNTSRIYVNEHLTYLNKQLLKKARDFAKQHSFKYVWTKNGRIYVRKEDTKPAFQITQEKDLLKIR